MKLVIIGGGVAGVTLATRVKRFDPDMEITIIDKAKHISTSVCSFPFYISDTVKEFNDLIVKTPDDLKKEYNIEVKTQAEVIDVDIEDKSIKIIEGNSSMIYKLSYDKLVIATGCSSVTFNEFNSAGDNIFLLKNIVHADRLKKYIKENNSKTALLIGGGITNIELAENLNKIGIDVTILEKSENVLSTFDKNTIELVSKDLRKHIKVYTNAEIDSVKIGKPFEIKFRKSDDSKDIIFFENNKEYEYDIIVVSAGLKANSGFLKNTVVVQSKRKYVFVNSKFETSVPNIYAIGDIAIVKSKLAQELVIPKTSSVTKLQARKLAEILTGQDTTYEGSILTNICRVFDKILGKTGINETQAFDNKLNYIVVEVEGYNHSPIQPDAEKIKIKGIFRKDNLRLLGAEVYGGEGTDKRIDILATAVTAKMTAYDLEDLELAYSPPFSTPRDIVNVLGSVAKRKWNEINKDN